MTWCLATSAATFGYDNNGNLTSKTEGLQTTQYVWDFENRLSRVSRLGSQDVWYKYDALGRRIERDKGIALPIQLATETTRFVYNGPDVMRDLNGNGATIADYLNGPGIDNKLRQTASGTASYFATDHQGTTRTLTDSNGTSTSSLSYDSFGNATNGSQSTRYTYTGREYDLDTGLMYYRARSYDSQQGRFLSEDPIGFAGGMNGYAYVSNNPVNAIDPTGLYEVDVHYYLTYYLASRNGCFTVQESRDIANGDQFVDELFSTAPGKGAKGPNWDWRQIDDAQLLKNMDYHALHPGLHLQDLDRLWQGAIQGASGNLFGLGRYLHYVQDMYSHAGYENPEYGHLFGTHLADKTSADVAKAQTMVASTWQELNRFAMHKCGCQGKWTNDMWPTINEFLNAPGGNWWTSRKYSIDERPDLTAAYLERKKQILGGPSR